jgi:cytochrome c-type biogenesis protein CcmH/NrfG
MSETASAMLPPPSAADQKLAAGQFEYAHRAAAAGNYDLAIRLLRTCCELVPGNLSYRQALRKAAKNKYKNNKRGSSLAWLTTWFSRYRLWGAARRGDHLRVLELGEIVLASNPWDRSVNLLMAEAADALNLRVMAIWMLQEARDRDARDVPLNRALARLLEKDGHFKEAIALWQMVRQAVPTDREAEDKCKQLAVNETIARGHYKEVAAGEIPAIIGAKLESAATTRSDRHTALTDRLTRDIASTRERIAESPTQPELYVQLAHLLLRKGDLDAARQALNEGLDLTDQAIEIRLALADLDIEPYRRAQQQNEEQLQRHPTDEKLLKNQKKIAKKINELELALFRQRVEHDPSNRTYRFELAVRLQQTGQPDEAIPHFQFARTEPRLQFSCLLHLGQCFLERKNWPLAQRNLEEALKHIPRGEEDSRKEVLFLLASGHAESGDLQTAIELGLDLANLDYGYRHIGSLVEQWQRRLSESGPARRQ